MSMNMRQLRNYNKLKQQEVVEQTGISISMLKKIESGDREPGRENMVKLAKLYDCTMDTIYEAVKVTVSEKQMRKSIRVGVV